MTLDKILKDLNKIADALEELKTKREEMLETAEDAEKPNEDRICLLEAQAECLEEAIGACRESIEILEGYEK